MKKEGFVLKLLESRDVCHAIHWATASDAEHRALGKFYKEIQDLTDVFSETLQGKYGKLSIEGSIEVASNINSIEYLKALYNFIEDNYKSVVSVSDADLLNIIADIKQLINQTLDALSRK